MNTVCHFKVSLNLFSAAHPSFLSISSLPKDKRSTNWKYWHGFNQSIDKLIRTEAPKSSQDKLSRSSVVNAVANENDWHTLAPQSEKHKGWRDSIDIADEYSKYRENFMDILKEF